MTSSHTDTTRIIGAHVSAAGGIDKAIERAHAIGANAAQVFSGSPRSWGRSPLDLAKVELAKKRQQELGMNPIITHAIYLTNIASDNAELVKKSTAVLKYDLEFDAAYGGGGVVVHLGSHQGRGWEAMRDQVATSISEILKATPDNSTFLIENSAGQQGKVCGDLTEIQWLIDQVKMSSRLGWCVDTCHAHAAGYALGPNQKAENQEHPPLVDEAHTDVKLHRKSLPETIAELKLWPHLKCIHVNDSRDPFASGRDRHANLGDGEINKADLKSFLNLPEVQRVPMVLEVPGINDEGPDAENISRLRALIA